MRKTKIVATLGPASNSIEKIKELFEKGVNIFRINFSHGSQKEHQAVIENIRKADVLAAIMLDTQGPEIRIGEMEEGVELVSDQEVVLTGAKLVGNQQRIPVNFPQLAQDLKQGVKVLLADGLIELEVTKIVEDEIYCKVLNGGPLSSRKGVNIPGVKVNLPSLTAKDESDISFGAQLKLDFVAASFIRSAADVHAIRGVLEQHNSKMQIIAKIENQEGIDNIDEIIEVADCIMVARGDMGVEVPPEKVPLIQKTIIQKCNLAGKAVITATQMLESMIRNPRPTRAEASDVANAILDGTDATMLSGETAIGQYPVQAVKTMSQIALEVESSVENRLSKMLLGQKTKSVTDSISYATCATARDLEAAAIITATRSGHTARMVSKYRPQTLIIAATSSQRVLKQLLLCWGVYPILVPPADDTDSMIEASVGAALKIGFIKAGDLIVITAGTPVGIEGSTNLLKVHTAAEIIASGTGIGNYSVSGAIKLIKNLPKDLNKVQAGDIVVAKSTDRDFIEALEKAGAIITEEAGLTSHAAIVGLSLKIPVVVGVKDALQLLNDYEIVTLDGLRGLIYRGLAKVY